MKNDALEAVRGLVIEAGRRIMPFYRAEPTVTIKHDSSPLTAADLAAHQFLVETLPKVLSDTPVISEESADETHSAASGLNRFWLVDPLDGTKEFLKATGEFTVNVALIENGRPVLGAVHAPVLGLSYFASGGSGAWRQSAGGTPVRVGTRCAVIEHLAVVASKDHAGPMVKSMLDRLSNPTLRSMGSSLKFCLVADGSADLYLRDVPTMEWDTAAAQCVVEAAGGSVCSLDGKPLRYGKPGLKNPALMTSGDPSLDWRQFTCGAEIAP